LTRFVHAKVDWLLMAELHQRDQSFLLFFWEHGLVGQALLEVFSSLLG